METRSICPYCGVGCGIVLRSEEGRVQGLIGDPRNPINRGALCPKGATAHEFVHHPDRLTHPLIRRGGELVRASWDEALGAVAEGLARVVREHGRDAVGLVSSARATVEENWLAQKFARAVIGTNHLDNCFRVCHSATVTGLMASLGAGGMTNPIADLGPDGPRALLVVGSNTTRSHPIIWTEWMRHAVAGGAQLVVIDPRETEIARHAEVHLAARPGSEMHVFHAMAHHILANGWQDDAFIEERTAGFDALAALVERHTPASAAEVAGVAARDIERAAEIYATDAPASIVYGLGVTEHTHGVDNVRALANLALLTGNLGKPFTGVNALRGQNNVQGATDMCRPESLPGYQSWDDPDAVARFERVWGVRLPRPAPDDFLYCARMWEAALTGQLKALYLIGTDPALTEGNLTRVRGGLASVDLLVVQDVFPTPTSALAHVVLPACSYAEKEGTFVNTERRVQRVRQAIPPLGESRPDWQILCDLATRMGRPMGIGSPREAFEEIRTLVPSWAGISYERIEDEGLAWPCPDEESPGTSRLHVGTFAHGKAQFAAVEPRGPGEVPDAEYPFLLTTGRTFLQYNCGSMTRRTRMEKGEPAAFVEISPADAARLGLDEWMPVRVRTRRGELVVPARLRPMAEGVCWMPFHFAETPTNLLTGNLVDPECGITELKACAARLEPA